MNKSLVQQQFGAHAAAYATSTVHAKGASLGRLVELVQPKPSWHALDVATGAGHTAAAFAPHVARVVASDLTPEMLQEAAKLAKAKGFANMETAPADAEALPFDDASFDLVTCRIAPHHFPDVPTFVAEVWRTLKGGGTFALVDNIAPDAEFDAGLLQRRAARCGADLQRVREDPRPEPRPLPRHGRVERGADRHRLRASAQGAPAQGHGVPVLGRAPGRRATTTERLRSMLTDGSPALRAFLKPRVDGDKLWFTLDEALLIARKPA